MPNHPQPPRAQLLIAIILTLVGVAPTVAQTTQPTLPFDEPLFDHHAIQNHPLDVTINEEQIEDGLIIRKLHFTAGPQADMTGQPNDQPQRIEAIMVMPEKGEPKGGFKGLLWCQGGMAPAHVGMPRIFAKKGYACIVMTIPIDKATSWSAWDASNPKAANMTRYAHMQMRALTVLANDPRVNAYKLGVVGASYGGFFATLVAGADPRVKAGAAFFSGGCHNLGTNLPQFTKMQSEAEVDIWMKTIDPAWRHRYRDVPFLWTLPTNDNWFYFPAVIETFRQAKSEHNRICILPYWTHGFPPNIDQQIFDWLDVHLKKTRESYIDPGKLQIMRTDKGLQATWRSDSRPIKSAELVVSPNAPAADESPWLGQWVYRLHQPFPATLSADRMQATATIPVLDASRPMYVYGNITDENDVLTSTMPVLLSPPYPNASPRFEGDWNGCPWGDLEPEKVQQLSAMAQRVGEADEEIFYEGKGSARATITPDMKARAKPRPVKLFHVPHLAHQLKVAVRTESQAKLRLTVEAVPAANWHTPAVTALMGEQPEYVEKRQAVIETTVSTQADWRQVTIDVPKPTKAIEGYQLRIDLVEPKAMTYWVDAITFTPVAPTE